MAGHYVTYKNGNIHFSGGSDRTDYSPKMVTINQTNASAILANTLSSEVTYFIDGIVDLTGMSRHLEVPSSGLSISGFNYNVSQLICSDNDYALFSSEDSGDLLITKVALKVNGSNSKVFDLTSSTGDETIELNDSNFNSCTSIGEIIGFRQYFESGTGRFGGTPELTFSGSMDGAFIRTSIVRNISNITSLFKTGDSLLFSGRFISDINCRLPATGALCDFSASNFTNNESLIFTSSYMSRQGVINSEDSTIYPNIDHTNIKSLWKDNVGLPNTTKYIKGVITSETETTISASDTYYPLEGTYTIDIASHFDQPSSGEFRLLSGNGTYLITGDIQISGGNGDVLELKVSKSIDNGSTFPITINEITRVVNNFAGTDDIAFFTLSFLATLKRDDRVRVEIKNVSDSSNATALSDSYLVIKQA